MRFLLLSKDGGSELSEKLWEEYERFCERDLGGYDVVDSTTTNLLERV